jgi:ribosomal protein S18 acetylase RimI-like enzyme
MKQVKLTEIQSSPLTPDLKKHIYETFARHAIYCTGINGLDQDPLAFEIRDGETLAGCVVIQLFWGQLHIKYLFVEESHRNQGIATALMKHALDYGRSQGCTFAFVETMSFQAPDFYQKLGFKIDFTRPGYAKGTSFHYLRMDL